MKIAKVAAQELLDSRGNPTVEAIVILENGLTATAMVPSGASTGVHEALELRDGNPRRYLGRGVLQAVAHVNEMIAPAVVGRDVTDQAGIDNHLMEIDGTPNKSKVGANAILSVSIACLKAGALAEGVPFFEYVASLIDERPVEKFTMPILDDEMMLVVLLINQKDYELIYYRRLKKAVFGTPPYGVLPQGIPYGKDRRPCNFLSIRPCSGQVYYFLFIIWVSSWLLKNLLFSQKSQKSSLPVTYACPKLAFSPEYNRRVSRMGTFLRQIKNTCLTRPPVVVACTQARISYNIQQVGVS